MGAAVIGLAASHEKGHRDSYRIRSRFHIPSCCAFPMVAAQWRVEHWFGRGYIPGLLPLFLHHYGPVPFPHFCSLADLDLVGGGPCLPLDSFSAYLSELSPGYPICPTLR